MEPTPGTDAPSWDPHAAGEGAVMLDIGGDIGAIIVVVPEKYVGREIEIVPADGHTADAPVGGFHAGAEHPEGAPPHVGVVPRRMGPRLVPTAVFSDLSQGRYVLTLIAPHHHEGDDDSHGGDDHGHDHHDDGHDHHDDHGHEAAEGVGDTLEVDVVGGEVVTVDWPGV